MASRIVREQRPDAGAVTRPGAQAAGRQTPAPIGRAARPGRPPLGVIVALAVSEVSAIDVARMTFRLPCGSRRIALSCSGNGRSP